VPEADRPTNRFMNRLKNKISIITGTGDGIGRGIAMAFAQQGAKLAVCDINEKTRRNESCCWVR
jgi:NAD(P)-dependent dehydrogenase (short-subunit alcohol dehydrogenase family)